MIISENSECYRMISQNDHGDLAQRQEFTFTLLKA